MKRMGIGLLAAVWLLLGIALAEEPEMQISISGDPVLPGQASVVEMIVPEDGICSIRVLDGEDQQVSAVALERSVTAGYSAMYWNGTFQGAPAPEGTWRLVMEMNGRKAETPVTVGRMIPWLISPSLSVSRTTTGRNVTVSFCATEEGQLRVSLTRDGTEAADFRLSAQPGDNETVFPASVAPGTYQVSLTLLRDDGTASDTAVFPLEVTDPETVFSPSGTALTADRDYSLNGWTVPMDITDEEAVWQALTADVTVVDDGKSSDLRRQMLIRKEPAWGSKGIGVVTLISQGVHVLERGEEWSLIECYSSSFAGTSVENWNALVRGYVPTAYLKTKTPNQEMGLVVDKLTQRLYIFVNGKLYSTLLVSTGLTNERQPYNETRSGEYLLVSKVGGFYSDNMYCPLAIRFNAGDLLHEVPYVKRNMDYSMSEPKLGTKASHGCIRVQRKPSPEGVNMQWLWGHYRENTKILIWEDWQGRQIPIPGDDTILYTNVRKNTYYHSTDRCSALGTRRPGTITYGELSGEAGKKLTACPYCGPMPKKDKLLEINLLYAEGGDHDPIITKAREAFSGAEREK